MSSFPSTAQLLISGDDARMQLDSNSGTNHYLCRPCPEPDLLRLGSSTASTISTSGFATADRLRNQMADEIGRFNAESVYAAHGERIRQEIRNCCRIDEYCDILLTASGTISHRLAMQIIQHGTKQRAWFVLMVDAAETGRGVPAALCPADQMVSSAEINIRDADGIPLPAAVIDAAVITQVEQAIQDDKNIVLVMVDQSKSGCIAPSLSCALDLRQRFPDQLHLLLDACQFRISQQTLHHYLDHAVMVMITGSKFLAGPSFSAALFIPNRVAAKNSDKIHTAASLPAAGLLLRWQVALTSWQALQALDQQQIKPFLQQFAGAMEQRLMHDERFSQLPAPALHRGIEKTTSRSQTNQSQTDQNQGEWDQSPTIFPFMLRLPSSQGYTTYASHAESLAIYQYLQLHADMRVQLGRPIHVGLAAKAQSAGALRLCISAPMIVDAIQRKQQHAIINQAMLALDQVYLAGQTLIRR